MTFKRSYLLISIPFAGTLAFAAVLTGTGKSEVLKRDFDAVEVEKLLVENTSGKITITKSLRSRIEISAVKRKVSDRCTFDTEKTDYNEVIVKVEKPITETCEIDIDIDVPEKIDVSLWTGSGAVSVNGVEGKLSVNSGSAPVTANGKFTNVVVKSGSGAVDIAGLAGGGDIANGSGSLNLKFLDGAIGTVDVKSGSGDASFLLPKNSKLNAKLLTGSGDIQNEIENRETAALKLNVKAGSGDLSVKAY